MKNYSLNTTQVQKTKIEHIVIGAKTGIGKFFSEKKKMPVSFKLTLS